MKCARCSNELSDSSTFCPRCGFNQQQNLNYTSPESYTGTGRERSSSFSYLPAGAPPWPTSVPQNVPGIVAPIPQGQQPIIPTRIKADGKPGRTARGIISVIAVIVLAPIIGILIVFATVGRPASSTAAPAKTSNSSSSSQQSAATPVPSTPAPASTGNQPLPTPTSFKTAKDTNVNISLQYPSNWTQGSPKQTTTATSLNIASQDQSISFFVTHFNDSASTNITNADQLNQSNIQQLTQFQDVHNLQNIQASNNQPSIAGAKWIEKDAIFLDSTNTKTRFSTISVQHGKSYYVIYFFVPDGVYTEAMQKYISPMLNSIKFLS